MKFLRSLLLLSVFTTLLAVNSSCQQAGTKSGGTQTVATADFKQLVDKHEAVLLDVRTPGEYAEGHLAGSTNVDYENPGFSDEIQKLDKNKPYLVYCRSGRRSAAAMQQMKDAGFTNVTNLDGGIMGWQNAGLPVEK